MARRPCSYGEFHGWNSASLPAEQPFLEYGADAKNMAGEDGEGNDEEGEEDGCGAFEDEVVRMRLEPYAYIRQFGQEEIMDEIDVKRAYTDVLEHIADAFLFGEPFGIVAEEGEDEHHQGVHRQGARKIGPLQPQQMPL